MQMGETIKDTENDQSESDFRAECLPIVTNVPKSTVVTQFDLIQSS